MSNEKKTHNQEAKDTAIKKWESIFLKGEKECSRCKIVHKIENFEIKKDRTYLYLNSFCKTCDKKRTAEYKNKKGSTIEGMSSFLFNNMKRRCKEKDLICDFDKEYIIELWKKQEGLCFYTKQKMELYSYRKFYNQTKKNKYVVSLDRFDSSKGYYKDNVVLCCWCVNNIKQDLTLSELKEWCKLILQN
jgi:hypothetical protein